MSNQPVCYNATVKRSVYGLLALFWLFFILIKPSFAQYKEEPQIIVIPSVGINLPIGKAKIIDETWEVLNEAASYGETTALPGEKGNTVIFSHAINSLFGQLPNVKKGDFVYLVNDSYTFTYQIREISSIYPEDIGILSSTNEKALILYTCEGTSDERRFTAKAILVDVSKSCRHDPPLTKSL